MSRLPLLIIGQGLAGTALAWRLHERGAPFQIVDRDEPLTSSKVAAGLVTPITGMRLNLSWRYDTLYPEALRFYRELGDVLGQTLFHPTPIVRLLRDEKAARLWSQRRLQPEIRPYVENHPPDPLVDEGVFANPCGGFQQAHAGWLDTTTLLAASRAFFESRGQWRKGQISQDEVRLTSEGVTWQDKPYSTVVFCTGWEAARQPWFSWLPFQSARGTILSIRADTGGERRVINRGCWLLPRPDGSLRAGPTYEVGFDPATPHLPAPAAVAGLETKLRALLKAPFVVAGAQTAVRPIIRGREILLGRHPGHPQIAFLNGLASKGALRAPWAAAHLTAHLLDGDPLDPDVDLAGNL